MKKFIRTIFSLLLSFFATTDIILAAPVINGISGSPAHGKTLLIGGTGFGVKTIAAPFMWDNFENGTPGNPLSTARWGLKTISPTVACYNNSNVRNSSSNTLSLYSEILHGSAPSFWLDNVTSGRKIYLNMWIYYDHGNGEPLSGSTYQVKTWRFHVGTNSYNIQAPSAPLFCWDSSIDGDNNANYYIPITYSGAAIPPNPIYGTATPTRTDIENKILFNNYWMNVQWEFEDSSEVDAYDACLKVYYSYEPSQTHPYFRGEIPDTSTGQVWATHISGKPNDRIKSVLFQNYIDALSGGANIYYDDIYIDNTWARVEIGNASDYNSCTHREIQLPAAWDDGSISITVNQGSFSDGETGYLYVIDENGISNANGYAINFDSATILQDTIHPAPPKNITIQ